MIFFYFCSWKWLYFICSCSITNTVISLVAHKLYQILINNQEKFMTRSSKLKVHKANSHSISSYPIKFFTDILFSSLVSFAFCFLVFLFFKKIKNIYYDTHSTMRTGEWFPVSRNKITFLFGLRTNDSENMYVICWKFLIKVFN